jgi:hypothetical protein
MELWPHRVMPGVAELDPPLASTGRGLELRAWSAPAHELGRIERTLFILDWLQSVELRRRVHAGLNKGEARNALAMAVFIDRLGEIRDRSFEQRRYRSGDGGHRAQEHGLFGASRKRPARDRPCCRCPAVALPVAPGCEHITLTGDFGPMTRIAFLISTTRPVLILTSDAHLLSLK